MVSSQTLAKSIVKGSLRPKPDEVVLISTYPHTMELAEQTALECQKAGADPALWLETDALFYGNFKNYSVESLHRVSGHCVGLLDYVNSYIWFFGPRNPAPMATVPREKFAAMFEGEKAHFDKAFEKMPKNVAVAIGSVTRERAKTYGFNYAKWKAMVEAATVVNQERLAALGNLVAGLISRPVDVRVTADNGTKLKFRLAGPERAPRIPAEQHRVRHGEHRHRGQPRRGREERQQLRIRRAARTRERRDRREDRDSGRGLDDLDPSLSRASTTCSRARYNQALRPRQFARCPSGPTRG